MKAHEFLDQAQQEMINRGQVYDNTAGERSIPATVAAFKAVTGITLTEQQGWLFLALLKAVRSQQGKFRADSFVDGAAYFALAGESAYKASQVLEPDYCTSEKYASEIRSEATSSFEESW